MSTKFYVHKFGFCIRSMFMCQDQYLSKLKMVKGIMKLKYVTENTVFKVDLIS